MNIFIHASSESPLGSSEDFPYNERSLPRPVSQYGVSKLSGEAYVNVYSNTLGLPGISLRFSNVYGSGCFNKGSVVSKMTQDALKFNKILVFGDGRQTRDMLPIDLLNKMIFEVLTATQVPQGLILQLGTGVETTMVYLAQVIQERLRSKYSIPVEILHKDALPGDVRRGLSDITLFEETFFIPNMDQYGYALNETIDYIFDLKESGLI